jgi:hypothetical protein
LCHHLNGQLPGRVTGRREGRDGNANARVATNADDVLSCGCSGAALIFLSAVVCGLL